MSEAFRDITLPISGLAVRVSNRRFKVLDNVAACDLVGGDLRNPFKMLAAKIALVTSFPSGGKVVYEEILEWDEDDMAPVMGLRDDPVFMQSPGGTSSGSPDSPTGA